MKYLIIAVVLLIPQASFSFVIGGSNLTMGRYPEHSCLKPVPPIRPIISPSRLEIETYNSLLGEYKSMRQMYISCLQEYVDNATKDIERIQEKVESVVDEAKRRY